MLVFCSVAFTAAGQRITGITLPNNLCAGAHCTLTFGHNQQYNINIFQPTTTMGQAGQVFLPDGEPCGSMGCSYRSTVTFTDFYPGTTITSAQNIKYVRLNIEHSYIGDIYIGITCPNNQKAVLMPWKGTGSSSCTSAVPSNARQWSSGSNVPSNTFLGAAYDYTSPYANLECDSTASGNEPGVGWNYCWSNNTTSGYSYASGDGLIYRSGHAHNGRIDSSNVAAHTNFYKPEQNFNALVGCPLNGTWYIEVIDAYGGDNGYIFGWELALDPSLIPQPCNLTGRDIIGTGITKINDSTYTLDVPTDITTDSTMLFTLRMLNSCGDTIDSVVSIAVHPNYDTLVHDTVCDQYAWNNGYVTADCTLQSSLHTRYQCDSVVNIQLKVLHSTSDTLVDTIVENSLPYSVCDTTVDHEVSDTVFRLTNAVGCDSLYHFTLTVWPNVDTMLDSTVCAHQLPVNWRGFVFDSASIKKDTLLNMHGADSVVVMMLKVNHDDTVYVTDTVIQNNLPYSIADTVVGKSYVDTLFHLVNQLGCDSSIHLALFVWPNVETVLDTTACRHQMPITWKGITVYGEDTVSVLLTDSHGADSTVTMRVAVLDDDTVYRNDTIVENDLPYSIQGGYTFGTDSDTTLLLQNMHGCDSTVHYTLKVWRNVRENYSRSVCEHDMPYTWNDLTFEGPGTKVQHLYTSHGADSVVRLTLELLPDYSGTETGEICDNESYQLGPNRYNTTGQYEYTFTTVDGCDSLIKLDLTVWPTYSVEFFDTACRSEGINVGGVRYYDSGILPYTYTTAQGCDSLVTLHLTIKGYYLKARAHISPSIVTPENLDVEIYDNSRAAIDRLWLIGDDFQSTEEAFNYTYPEEYDSVPLYLIAYSEDGCADTLYTILQIDRSSIFVPNAFTPSQSTNDRWYIVAQGLTELEVWIYNRQGNLVYHYEGMDGYWDGGNCPQGSYVFKAEYRVHAYPDRKQSLSGTILLIR